MNKNLIFIKGAKLTAGTGNGQDPIGSGYIRLTEDARSQEGGVFIDEAFPSNMGVVVEFEYVSWTKGYNQPADGTSVFLFDAKYNQSTFNLGDVGAGLGYGGVSGSGGATGGYLGVGLDEYGNWGKAYYLGDGGLVGYNKPNRYPNISIRGQSPRTQFIVGERLNNLGLQLSSRNNAQRPDQNDYFRQFRVAILFDASSRKYNVSVQVRTSVNGAWRTLLQPKELDYAPPDSLKVGLAASTGAEYAYHELRNLRISTPGEIRVTSSIPVNVTGGRTASYTVTVHNDSPSDLRGISFTHILPPLFVPDSQPVFNGGSAGNLLVSDAYNATNRNYEASLDIMHNSSCTFTFNGKFTNIRRDTITGIAYAKVPTRYTDTNIPNDTTRFTATLLSPYASFGDAPASYGVAEHRVDYTLHLGTWDSTVVQTVPAHSDSANTAVNDNAASVVFAGGSTVIDELSSPDFYIDNRGGLVVSVPVNALGKSAMLFAWIDFDRNGKFDASEAADISVTGSRKYRLTFNNALSKLRDGITYMRLRLSTDPALTSSRPDGILLDGDVEDYMIHFDAIEVSKSVSPTVAGVGDTLNYSITVRNKFPFAISTSGIFDTLSSYLAYIPGSATPNPTSDTPVNTGSGNQRRQAVKWGSSSPPPGGAIVYTFKAEVTDAPQIYGDSLIENYASAVLNGGSVRSDTPSVVRIKAIEAVEDLATTTMGRQVSINLPANDVFHGCTRASISVGTQAGSKGTVSTDANNNAVYTPDVGQFGIDSFSYVLNSCLPNIAPDSTKVYVLTLKPDALKYMACPGVSVTLGISPIPGVSYLWYDAQTDGNLVPGGGNTDKITINNILRSQSLWIEARWNGKIFPRLQISIDIDNSCGDVSQTGCALTGTLIWKEDFDYYDDGLNPASNTFSSESLSPGMTTYAFAQSDQNTSAPTLYREGFYAIIKRGLNNWPGRLFTDDHTSPNDNRIGRFLIVNGKNTIDKVYEQNITNLCPGTTLYLSFWMRGTDALMRWTVYSSTDSSALATFLIPALPKGSTGPWLQYGFKFTVPDNVDSVYFNIYNYCIETSGNDFAIDDIEVRLCISPVVARINGKTNETICFGDSIKLTVDPYTDDGVLIVSSTDSLEGYWTKSSTGDLNKPSDWSIIPGTRIKGAAGVRTLIIPPFNEISSSDGTVYYRFAVMKANADSILNTSCRAISDVLSASGRGQITEYPDIRLQLCPDPSRPVYLSSYIDSLYFKSLVWSMASNGSPSFRNNSETGTGELRSEDFAFGTHIYQYNIVNECASDSGKVYIKVLSKSVVGFLPDTVVVCRLIPSSAYLQLNQILGIEANGTWNIPAELKSFITESSSPSYFAGAYVFDAQSAWASLSTNPTYNIAYNGDVNSAAFKFTYGTGTYANPPVQSCVGNTEHELVIIVTSKIFTL